MSEQAKMSPAESAAREVAFALNRSHCTGEPIHEITHALLGDASELGDIVDDFAEIVTPIIAEAIAPSTDSEIVIHRQTASAGLAVASERSRDSEIANLEWRVVEAAVAHRAANMEAEKTWKSDGEDPPDFREKMWAAHSAMEDSRIALHTAVEALIAAREKVENG